MGSLERSLAEHGEALLVVRKVGAVGLAVQLRAGLTPHLGEEERVVDEDAVDALLVLVEVANLLAERVDVDGGVPRTLVLIVAGRDGHHLVATLGELDGEGADDVTETAGLGPGGNLGGDEDDLHGARRLGGVGHSARVCEDGKRTYGGSIGELSVGFLRWSASGARTDVETRDGRRGGGARGGRSMRAVDARGRGVSRERRAKFGARRTVACPARARSRRASLEPSAFNIRAVP